MTVERMDVYLGWAEEWVDGGMGGFAKVDNDLG